MYAQPDAPVTAPVVTVHDAYWVQTQWGPDAASQALAWNAVSDPHLNPRVDRGGGGLALVKGLVEPLGVLEALESLPMVLPPSHMLAPDAR